MALSTDSGKIMRRFACNLCDSQQYVRLFEEPPVFGEHFSIVKCEDCGLVSTLPTPSPQFLDLLYNSDHYKDHTVSGEYCSDEILSSADFDSVLARISALSHDGRRLLDVGCGRGLFLGRAAKDGWDVHGIEPSTYAADIAKEVLGARVQVGFLDESSYPASTFDVITLWYVLEHVPDPRATLNQAVRLLKPGGVIFVAVPNWHYLVIRRQLARLRNGRPGLVHAHEHLHQFTSRTLRGLFQKVGIDVLQEMCSRPYLISGATINGAKTIASVAVRLLFQMTGRNLSGILLFGRKSDHGEAT